MTYSIGNQYFANGRVYILQAVTRFRINYYIHIFFKQMNIKSQVIKIKNMLLEDRLSLLSTAYFDIQPGSNYVIKLTVLTEIKIE